MGVLTGFLVFGMNLAFALRAGNKSSGAVPVVLCGRRLSNRLLPPNESTLMNIGRVRIVQDSPKYEMVLDSGHDGLYRTRQKFAPRPVSPSRSELRVIEQKSALCHQVDAQLNESVKDAQRFLGSKSFMPDLHPRPHLRLAGGKVPSFGCIR